MKFDFEQYKSGVVGEPEFVTSPDGNVITLDEARKIRNEMTAKAAAYQKSIDDAFLTAFNYDQLLHQFIKILFEDEFHCTFMYVAHINRIHKGAHLYGPQFEVVIEDIGRQDIKNINLECCIDGSFIMSPDYSEFRECKEIIVISQQEFENEYEKYSSMFKDFSKTLVNTPHNF